MILHVHYTKRPSGPLPKKDPPPSGMNRLACTWFYPIGHSTDGEQVERIGSRKMVREVTSRSSLGVEAGSRKVHAMEDAPGRSSCCE